ncbi:MAG: hypothetical protein IKZ54_10425 [Bacteroidales bacterium]|nr:hypothetical protein [Bacteroidales bacterium]
MKQLFVIILVFTLAICSCGRKTDSKVDPLDVDCVADTYTEGEEELSHFSDTLTTGQYHQMILDAIANGDKQLFAKMVSYPLYRQYPLHDVENEQQMVRYFDTLFDKQFRQQIAKLDSNSWDNVGWRGWMILDGEIWDVDPRIVVNYSSPLEQRYAEYLKKKDMARLHSSLRGNWEPYCCFSIGGSACPIFDFAFARVDVSRNNDSVREPDYRVAMYKKGMTASEEPSFVLFGKRTIEGSMQLETLYFKSDEYAIVIVLEDIEDGKSYFSIYKGKEACCSHLPCKMCMQPFQ